MASARAAPAFLRVDSAHPAPAAAGDSLREDGEPDLVGFGDELSMSRDAGVDLSTGTPAAIACSFAVTLLPAISSTCLGGPMNVMPASAAACASSGFSERKP